MSFVKNSWVPEMRVLRLKWIRIFGAAQLNLNTRCSWVEGRLSRIVCSLLSVCEAVRCRDYPVVEEEASATVGVVVIAQVVYVVGGYFHVQLGD